MILYSKGCKLFLMCVSVYMRVRGKGGRGVALESPSFKSVKLQPAPNRERETPNNLQKII